MKQGRTLQELAAEIERQSRVKRDLLADIGAMSISDGVLAIGNENFGINDVAHRQISAYLKIPFAYYERMRNEYPSLLEDNANAWLGRSTGRRLVRTLDGTARAFLSKRYRRIDNREIAETVLPIISDMPDAQVKSCEITDTRMYIKVVTPKIQGEVTKGDIVQAGIVISNSEVGYGCVNILPLLYRLVCSNGMIAQVNESGMKKYHTGSVIELGDDEFVIGETDNSVFLSELKNTVKAAIDPSVFGRLLDRMRESKEVALDAWSLPQVVELAQKEYRLTEKEGQGILGHLISGGDLSLYGLGNAVTRHAQDVENYDRSQELESIGYKIITMPESTLKRIKEAA